MSQIRLKTKVSYGVAGVGDSAFYNLMGSFCLFYLTTVVGMNAGIAGGIIALGAVWQTVTGAVVGYISDNFSSRYGKRKPFIVVGSVALLPFSILMFINLHLPDAVATLYYGMLLILFWSAFSVFFIPYMSWGAEIVRSYDERTAIRGFTSIFSSVGFFLGMVMPNIIVDVFEGLGFTKDASWCFVGIICGVISSVAVLIGALNIKDQNELAYERGEYAVTKMPKINIILLFKELAFGYFELLKIRSVRLLIGTSVFFLLGNTMFAGNRLYFFTYNMGLPSEIVSFVLAFPIFATFILVPIVTKISRKLDKKHIFICALSISAVGLFTFGFINVNSVSLLFCNYIVYTIGNTVYWQLMPATIYDMCEADQLINHKNRAGLLVSLQSLSESLSNALGFQILGLVLSIAGFDGTIAVQCDTALLFTKLFFTVIPALFFAGAVFMLIRYPINKRMFGRILEALEKQKAGEEIDMTEFSKI